MPDLPALRGFGAAAQERGWAIELVDSDKRPDQIARISELVARRRTQGTVIVITGEPDLLVRLDDDVEIFTTLDSVPAI